MLNYLAPRFCIVEANSAQIGSLLQKLTAAHSNYFHIFNLTAIKPLHDAVTHVKVTNLAGPFCLTDNIKLLTQVDTYLKANVANTAVFTVQPHGPHSDFIPRLIFRQLGIITSDDQVTRYIRKTTDCSQHLLSEQLVQKTYLARRMLTPPVRIIEKIELKGLDMIPVFQIFTQGRYASEESVYFHRIEEQLTEYYLTRNQPEVGGFGTDFYDSRPQTQHLKAPAPVFGDFTIRVYSFQSLKLYPEFLVRLNTLFVNKGQIRVKSRDFFSLNGGLNQPFPSQVELIITIDHFCADCPNNPRCFICTQKTSKLVMPYSEAHTALQSLCRPRTSQEYWRNIGLRPKQ